MKPPEILGMLEEAAGTRMYESKKEAALKTLEKKQVKVEEINKVSFCMAQLQKHISSDAQQGCNAHGGVDFCQAQPILELSGALSGSRNLIHA